MHQTDSGILARLCNQTYTLPYKYAEHDTRAGARREAESAEMVTWGRVSVTNVIPASVLRIGRGGIMR